MDANGVTNELFQAQTHIYKHMYSYIESMSLKCAVQLSIPDIVHNHKRPITLLDLASSLDIPSSKTNSLERLMRILVHSGFFSIEEQQSGHNHGLGYGYVLTPCSEILVKDNPTSLASTVTSILDPQLVSPWFCFSDSLLQGDDSSSQRSHHPVFEFETQYGGLIESFHQAMASDTRIVSSIVDEHGEVFEGLGSLVDVGGGDGTMARAVCEKFPLMDCVVLDLPQVVDGLSDEKKLKFVGGDMFEFVPSAEAILIKSVLHNWTDEDCKKILKRCKEAIQEKKGKLILIEMVIEESKNDSEMSKTRLLVDMEMMMLCQGKERTEAEWKNLFLESGFSSSKITNTAGLNSIIEVYP
ncbi:Trans-resveratrol di-O-methyltransferase [Linum grandiflorum]